jgi:hypothetical protein
MLALQCTPMQKQIVTGEIMGFLLQCNVDFSLRTGHHLEPSLIRRPKKIPAACNWGIADSKTVAYPPICNVSDFWEEHQCVIES